MLRFFCVFRSYVFADLFCELIFSITLNMTPRQLNNCLVGIFLALLLVVLWNISMLLGYNFLSVIIAISYTVVFIFLILERRQSKLDHAMVVA